MLEPRYQDATVALIVGEQWLALAEAARGAGAGRPDHNQKQEESAAREHKQAEAALPLQSLFLLPVLLVYGLQLAADAVGAAAWPAARCTLPASCGGWAGGCESAAAQAGRGAAVAGCPVQLPAGAVLCCSAHQVCEVAGGWQVLRHHKLEGHQGEQQRHGEVHAVCQVVGLKDEGHERDEHQQEDGKHEVENVEAQPWGGGWECVCVMVGGWLGVRGLGGGGARGTA